MRRRTLLVVLVGLAVVVAVGAVVLWPQPPSRITRENYDRIREGMSRAEAQAILGPPGDYTTGPLATWAREHTHRWRQTYVPADDDEPQEELIIDVRQSDSAFVRVRYGRSGTPVHWDFV